MEDGDIMDEGADNDRSVCGLLDFYCDGKIADASSSLGSIQMISLNEPRVMGYVVDIRKEVQTFW